MKLISSGWTIIIIGISISLMILSFAFFHYTLPYKTQATYEKDYADKLQTEGSKIPQTKKRVDTAIKLVNERAAKWDQYVETRTPPTSVAARGIDISVNPYQLLIDTWTFRNNVQRAVNAQVTKGNIKLIGTGPYVPGPADPTNVSGLLASYYNYPGIKFPIVIYNFGTITVQGTYQQIMDHIRSYKSMPHYLAVTDGLRLEGTSPVLTANYQLSIVGFIRGKKLFGAVPEASTAAAGGGGGFGGGGRGGFGGGAPGGFGGAGALGGGASKMRAAGGLGGRGGE